MSTESDIRRESWSCENRCLRPFADSSPGQANEFAAMSEKGLLDAVIRLTPDLGDEWLDARSQHHDKLRLIDQEALHMIV